MSAQGKRQTKKTKVRKPRTATPPESTLKVDSGEPLPASEAVDETTKDTEVEVTETNAPAETFAVSQPEPSRLPHRYRGLCVLAAVVLVLVVGLLTLVSHMSLLRVSVGGVRLSPRTTWDTVQRNVEPLASNYRLKVQDETGTVTEYGLSEAGITISTAASIDAAMAAQRPPELWKRLAWWQRRDIPLTLQVDRQEFQGFLQTKLTKPVKPLVNATVQTDGGQLVVVPEQIGRGYTIADAENTVRDSVAYLKTQPLVLTDQDLVPPVRTPAAEEAKRRAEPMLTETIAFTVRGRALQASRADIAAWLEFSAVDMDHTIDITVDSGRILEYLNRVGLSSAQAPRSQVVMTDPNGQSQVLIPGRGGLDIVNKDAVAAEIAKKVLAGQSFSADIPVDYSAPQTVTAAPRPKWLVVNLTTKRMYAYEQDKLVKTVLISAGSPTYPTVLGEYKINSKVRRQDMRGDNADGSRYFQPDVEWVNYFYGSYAIHGNYWRPASWFGNINSSHGCVGIMNDDAEWIYNWAPVGTPIIVHT